MKKTGSTSRASKMPKGLSNSGSSLIDPRDMSVTPEVECKQSEVLIQVPRKQKHQSTHKTDRVLPSPVGGRLDGVTLGMFGRSAAEPHMSEYAKTSALTNTIAYCGKNRYTTFLRSYFAM